MSAEFRGTECYVAWDANRRGPLFRLRSSDEVAKTSGEYFYNCTPKKLKPSVCDRAQAQRLWELSEHLVAI